jgi:hypothetical protein
MYPSPQRSSPTSDHREPALPLICAVPEVGLYPCAVAADEVTGSVMHELGGLVDPAG